MVFQTLSSFQFMYLLCSWFLVGSLKPLLKSSCRLALILWLAFSLFFTFTCVGLLPLWRWTARQPACHHLTACCGLGLLRVKESNFSAVTTLVSTKWLKFPTTSLYLIPFCCWDPLVGGILESCCACCWQTKRLGEKSKYFLTGAVWELLETSPPQNPAIA